jgi:hypothetical protein
VVTSAIEKVKKYLFYSTPPHRKENRMASKKKADNKKKYHLITNTNSDCDTVFKSFDSKEEVQEYLVSNLEDYMEYNFDNGNDVLIYGELQKVIITEKTYKVTIR